MARKTATSSPVLDFLTSNQRLPPQDFFRFCAEYPNKEGISVYVYRIQPVIDRGRAGIPTRYIDLVAGPIEETYLLRTWGSGKYQLCLSDASKPKGARMANTVIEIWDSNVEPVLNPQELCPDERGNDRWLQKYFAQGWTLEEVTHPISGRNISRLRAPDRGGDGGSAALGQTVEKLVDRLTERRQEPANNPVMSELISLIREKGTSQADVLKQAFDIADRLKPQTDPVQVQLLKTLGELVMKQASGAPAAPAPDPIAHLKQTMELLKDLGVGNGGGTSGSWMELVGALPGILQGGAQFLRELSGFKTTGQVIQMPGAAPPPPSDLIPAADSAAPPEAGMFNVQALMAVGKDAIDAFERGISGDDFAHALVCRSRDGEQLYAMLFNMGQEGIISAVSMVPGLAARLEPRRAELEAWLDAFLEYGKPEEENQPAPPPKKAA